MIAPTSKRKKYKGRLVFLKDVVQVVKKSAPNLKLVLFIFFQISLNSMSFVFIIYLYLFCAKLKTYVCIHGMEKK